MKRIHSDQMPPFKQRSPASVQPAAPGELEQIRLWIAAGAPEPRYEILDDESASFADSETGWWAFQIPGQEEFKQVVGKNERALRRWLTVILRPMTQSAFVENANTCSVEPVPGLEGKKPGG